MSILCIAGGLCLSEMEGCAGRVSRSWESLGLGSESHLLGVSSGPLLVSDGFGQITEIL